MPTKHRRHAITETPAVKAALDELRDELDGERVRLSELVILGAEEMLSRLRAERDRSAEFRRRLADRVRGGNIPIDPDAAENAKRHGWADRDPAA